MKLFTTHPVQIKQKLYFYAPKEQYLYVHLGINKLCLQSHNFALGTVQTHMGLKFFFFILQNEQTQHLHYNLKYRQTTPLFCKAVAKELAQQHVPLKIYSFSLLLTLIEAHIKLQNDTTLKKYHFNYLIRSQNGQSPKPKQIVEQISLYTQYSVLANFTSHGFLLPPNIRENWGLPIIMN